MIRDNIRTFTFGSNICPCYIKFLHKIRQQHHFTLNSHVNMANLQELLETIAEEEGITNPKVCLSGGALKGDGYFSQMLRADIEGPNKTLHLIVKCGPKDFSTSPHLRGMFNAEINFYNRALPRLLEFQASKGILSGLPNLRDDNPSKKLVDPFDSVGKCYKTVNTDITKLLVLENIKEAGYSMWNRKIQISEEHVSLVLKEYAKLHALSLAFADQKPQDFEELVGDGSNFFSPGDLLEDVKKVFVTNSAQFAELFDPKTEAELRQAAQKFHENVLKLRRDVEVHLKKGRVISHGDCWCNNMMFKYENNTPTSVRFYDFQFCKLSTPVSDVIYFFYTVASGRMLDNFETYKQIYYNALTSHIQNLGSNAEKVYPRSTFEEDWKACAMYGLLVSLVIFKAMYSDDDEVTEVTDGSGDHVLNSFARDIRSDVERRKQRDLFVHMYRNGFI